MYFLEKISFKGGQDSCFFFFSCNFQLKPSQPITLTDLLSWDGFSFENVPDKSNKEQRNFVPCSGPEVARNGPHWEKEERKEKKRKIRSMIVCSLLHLRSWFFVVMFFLLFFPFFFFCAVFETPAPQSHPS
ncbi:unnamed protein product, partial [Choristocarpus tenellus]